MPNPFVTNLKLNLQKNPEHCYVTDTYIAILMEDNETVLVFPGDFAGKSPEEVNEFIVNTINQITK